MSFILDALRRADAERERERGQLPDLHARSLSAHAAPNTPASGLPWPYVAVAAAALLLAVLALWLLLRASAPVPPPGPAANPALPESPTAATTAAPQVPASRPTASAPPLLPPPGPAPVAQASPPMPLPAEPPGSRPLTAKPVDPVAAAPTVPAVPVQAPRPARQAEAPMPALKVGGVMYAETPENRVLVINDQVLREGESVQPGLVLEHIGAKSAKLRWKDQVVEVPY